MLDEHNTSAPTLWLKISPTFSPIFFMSYLCVLLTFSTSFSIEAARSGIDDFRHRPARVATWRPAPGHHTSAPALLPPDDVRRR